MRGRPVVSLEVHPRVQQGSDDEHDLRKTRRYEQKFSNLLDKLDRELRRIADDEHDLRKTCRYKQKFSNLLDKQDWELRRIAKLEERFKLQAECLQADKARIPQMLHGQNYPSAPARHLGGAENRLRRIKSGSDSDDSSFFFFFW